MSLAMLLSQAKQVSYNAIGRVHRDHPPNCIMGHSIVIIVYAYGNGLANDGGSGQ